MFQWKAMYFLLFFCKRHCGQRDCLNTWHMVCWWAPPAHLVKEGASSFGILKKGSNLLVIVSLMKWFWSEWLVFVLAFHSNGELFYGTNVLCAPQTCQERGNFLQWTFLHKDSMVVIISGLNLKESPGHVILIDGSEPLHVDVLAGEHFAQESHFEVVVSSHLVIVFYCCSVHNWKVLMLKFSWEFVSGIRESTYGDVLVFYPLEQI